MPHEVSYPRLLAEVEAWPIVSASALRLCAVRLRREAVGVLDEDTRRLAEELERRLRLRSGGMSLSNLAALRDQCWFGGYGPNRLAETQVELAEYLESLAKRYLSQAGPRIAVRTEADADGIDIADRVAHWRWLSLRMPADLLVAALYARIGQPPSDRVSLATTHLERLLQYPVAETHLHVGAAFGFPVIWTTWMVWLSHDGPAPEELRLPEGHPFLNGKVMREYLVAAAIVRVLLAAFLWHRESKDGRKDFTSFVEKELRTVCRRLDWATGEAEAWRLCVQALTSFSGTNRLLRFALARRLYSGLTNSRKAERWQTLGDLLTADPLSPWLRPRADGPCAETLFATRAIQYLLVEGRSDIRFAEIFWQYTRVRCIAHEWLVQEPGTAGLDWFVQHYDRLRALRGPLNGIRYEVALQHQSHGLRLSSIEVRTAPESSWVKNRDEVRGLASAVQRWAATSRDIVPESGLVFHFIKRREYKLAGRSRLHADPGVDPTGFRFGVWFRERRREAFALVTLLRRHPELLVLVRGLDVASSELAVPTWAVAPLMRVVREASEEVSAALFAQQPQWRVPPMRVTCHAGEDFSRLVEGIRRVHELLEAGILRNGDRIGHGLALGVEPRRWADSAPVIFQPMEERLEDLLWELDRYASADVHVPTSRVERVRSEAVAWARELYREVVDLDTLREARRLRLRPGELERLGFPSGVRRASGTGGAMRILMLQLTDVGVFIRGQQLVRVRSDEGEVDFIRGIQQWLCAALARLEVTVECNPSSNLLIGDLLDIEEHPVLRLAGGLPNVAKHGASSMEESQRDQSRLMISINSDDPVTFATCLADEYAYLYFALLRRHVSAAEALEWIAARREHGMRSRFSLEESTDARALELIAAKRSL